MTRAVTPSWSPSLSGPSNLLLDKYRSVNAVAETFFATLTKERLLHDPPPAGWATRAELRSAVFEYIEGFYNPTRLHSTLGMRSPVEHEDDHAAGDPDGQARTGAREKTVDNLRLPTATTATTT